MKKNKHKHDSKKRMQKKHSREKRKVQGKPRSEKEYINKLYNYSLKNIGKKRFSKKPRTYLHAPERLCFINNHDEMISFLNKIKELGKYNDIFFLDLSPVTSVTYDAIIYLNTWMEHIVKLFPQKKIFANFPIEPSSRHIIISSGFYKYVKTRYDVSVKKADHFQILSGYNVAPDLAYDARNLSNEITEKARPESSLSGLYEVIIELMSNTFNHAYKYKTEHDFPDHKWWLMIAFDDITQRVHFTFLDRGCGIPTTLQKSVEEKENISISPYSTPMSIISDGELIESALKGEFRTRTKKLHRGKGLPRIYEWHKKGLIRNLNIFSINGRVNAYQNEITTLNRPFPGTLFSWDF